MDDLIAELRLFGDDSAKEAIPLELDQRTLRRVRIRQTVVALSAATLVSVTLVAALIGIASLRGGARLQPGTVPTPTDDVLYLDPPRNHMWFAPPGDAEPELTAFEALALFEASPDVHLPTDLSSRLGRYTAAVGDGTFRFQDRLAWGFTWHRCEEGPAGVRWRQIPSDSPSCTVWLFLDANTGEMLEAAWERPV